VSTANRFDKYQTDPVRFIQNELFGFVWSKQKEICESVLNNRFTAVQSCHGSGKTKISALIAAWWLSVWPPGEAFLVSSAPTGQQVKGLLWREINKVHRSAGLPGRTNQTEWWMNETELVGWGRAVRETDPTAFQGIHARRVLVILDEACGVTKQIHEAAETLVTNDDSRFLEIGNPDDPSTQFADNCKPGSGYNVIAISAFDTPNFTGEDVPDFLRHVLVGKTWVDERKRRWGMTSPLYIAKVLGKFPDVSTDGLIPLTALREAAEREVPDPVPGERLANELGVDVARFGNDKSTFYHRMGVTVRRVGESRKRDIMEVVGKVVALEHLLQPDAIKVDDTGLGGGVTDRLNELRFEGVIKAKVVPVIVGQAPSTESDEERYRLLRDQLHWGMRERFMTGNIVLLDAVDYLASEDAEIRETPVEGLEDLLAQAGSIKYKLTSRGQIAVESKDEMKKRGQPSPDDFDGLTLAFAPASLGGEMVLPFSEKDVMVEPIKIARFWPQAIVLHIERQVITAIWTAYHEAKDIIYLTGEYVSTLGELAVHVDAIKRRSKTRDGRDWDIPVVFALKTQQRPKDEGVRLAQRLEELGLNLFTVAEAPIEIGIPDMVARMSTQRLLAFDNMQAWFAEVRRFRRNAEGEILDGSIPLMHATSMLVQSGIAAGVMESQHDSDEDEIDKIASGRRQTANKTTGY